MLACASAVYVRSLPVIGSEIDVFENPKIEEIGHEGRESISLTGYETSSLGFK